MFKRILDLRPTLKRKSLFLLGPRQTGKSTFLRSEFPDALYINLLRNSEFQRLSSEPGQLSDRVRYFVEGEGGNLVIIDEVQKLPSLLDEVHDLIETYKHLRFILTGSSARKLKRGGANLLGGRATRFNFHPICFSELDTRSAERWLQRLTRGALPSLIDSPRPFADLKDYVGLYLREEIVAEGLSRSIDGFSRFLDFAAQVNGQQLNYTALGSGAQIAPSTIREYFNVLNDTLIGRTLPAFQETRKRKAVATGKFYFFDCGVINALLGRREIAPRTSEYGQLLETALFVEIKTYLDYHQAEKKIEYWRSTSQFEVDFLVYSKLSDIVAIEVKAGNNPGRKDLKGLLALEEDIPLKRKIVVCLADSPAKTGDGIEILPLQLFLEKLWKGQIV